MVPPFDSAYELANLKCPLVGCFFFSLYILRLEQLIQVVRAHATRVKSLRHFQSTPFKKSKDRMLISLINSSYKEITTRQKNGKSHEEVNHVISNQLNNYSLSSYCISGAMGDIGGTG